MLFKTAVRILRLSFFLGKGIEMNYLKALIFALIFALLFAACSDSDDDSKTSEEYLIGTWTGSVYDVDDDFYFDANLIFTKEGVFEFKLVEETPGHNDSNAKYRVEGGTIVIYEDSDCDEEGTYSFVADAEELNLTAITDPCEPRIGAIQGTWTRVE